MIATVQNKEASVSINLPKEQALEALKTQHEIRIACLKCIQWNFFKKNVKYNEEIAEQSLLTYLVRPKGKKTNDVIIE